MIFGIFLNLNSLFAAGFTLVWPFALLALLAIILLILIYIIKQNYQQKIVSSTFVWKLSMKYRKNRLPLNKFRNIIIFLCQLAAIVICAFIMAQPLIQSDASQASKEKILIIDAAANMLTVQESGETRFERAVKEVKSTSLKAIDDGGLVTVILAGQKAEYVLDIYTSSALVRTADKALISDALDSLIQVGQLKCSYGTADVDGAMSLAERVLIENARCEVIYFTATTYISKGIVNVVNLSDSEHNVAIMDASALKVENFYVFEVEIASYNGYANCDLNIEIQNAFIVDEELNGELVERYIRTLNVDCSTGATQVLVLDERITDFDEVYISIDIADAFAYDNSMYLYGNTKEQIKVLYSSSALNGFVGGALFAVREVLDKYWDIEIVTDQPRNGNYITEGYDFYLYEHEMPPVLPEDGAVLLFDPETSPANLSVVFGGIVGIPDAIRSPFMDGLPHPVTERVPAQNITRVTKYREITNWDGFDALMYCERSDGEGGTVKDPVLLVQNTKETKIAIIPYSVHYSDLAVVPEFIILLRNMFHYFMPITINQFVFDVYDFATINGRGLSVDVSGPELDQNFEEFPFMVQLPRYGTYTIKQNLKPAVGVEERTSVQKIYARIPKTESNFSRIEVDLKNPYIDDKEGQPLEIDLLIYLASVLVGLLFIEWILQWREQGA